VEVPGAATTACLKKEDLKFLSVEKKTNWMLLNALLHL